MNFKEDVTLVNKAQSGDMEAFEQLYKKYHASLLLTANRLTNNTEDAKDAVQMAFIQMHRSLSSLQDPKYFRLWMNKIVRGKCIDIFHKNKDVIVDVEESSWAKDYPEEKRSYLPEKQMKFVADQDILSTLISELPYDYKEVINYAYFSQFSMQEIAELLDIPIGTVKSRLFSAKKALRKKVSEYEKLYLYKLTFHMPGGISLLLLLSAHMQTLKLNGKSTFMGGAGICAGCTGIIVLGAGIGAYIQQDNQVNIPADSTILTKPMAQSTFENEQDAYFTLMNWAFDETQMSEKSEAEILEVKDEYEFLKEKEGPFWDTLQNKKWDKAYESLKSNR